MIPSLVLGLDPQTRIHPSGLTRHGRTAPLDAFTAATLAAGIPVTDLVGDAETWSMCARAYQMGLLTWAVPGLARARAFGQLRPLPRHPGRQPVGSDVAREHQAVVERINGPGGLSLSRFALLRAVESGWLLESGRSDWVVECSAAGVAALATLDQHPDVAALLRLTNLGVEGDADPAAAVWSIHDRYFAERSRRDSAALFHRKLEGDPPPARRENPPAGPRVALPVPTSPGPEEPTLWQAQAERQSVRQFAATPVALDALGTLLWRTLRVKQLREWDPAVPGSYEAVFRPVASGGAMHASDLWLLCCEVAGLPPGAWWYDPFEHALVGVPDTSRQVAAQLARLAAGGGGPAILGLLTVRHARTAWKYGPIAYALECKDVGVIMDQLNLTAGAVGLGFCAWGSGPTRAVCDLLGIDAEVDAPVGEFVLGVPG